jgi:hypothetical protein
MHCDPHTWGEQYVCRDNTCVGVKKLKSLPWLEKKWETLGDCQSTCEQRVASVPNTTFPNPALRSPGLRGAASPLPRPSAIPAPAPVPASAPAPLQLPLEHLKVSWRNCADVKTIVPLEDLTPSTIPVYGTTKLTGTGILPKDVQGGNFTIKLEAGAVDITLMDVWGDICSSKSVSTLYGMIRFGWGGLDCPVKAGKKNIPLSLTLSPVIPLLAAQTTTTVLATSSEGENLFCMEVVTTGHGKGLGPVFPTPPPTHGAPGSIVFGQSGKCLDLPQGNAVNGNRLWVQDCDASRDSQRWRFRGGQLMYAGAADSAMCVDVVNGLIPIDGRHLQLWSCNSLTHGLQQRFEFNELTHGLMTGHISIAGRDNFCMTTFFFGRQSAGTAVQIWKCDSSNANQIWHYTLPSNLNGELVV